MNVKYSEFEGFFLDHIDDRVILLDKDYKVLKVNKAAEEFFKENSDDIVNCQCQGICAFRDFSINEVCPAIEAKTEKKKIVEELITRTGETWEAKVYPLFDDEGEVDGFVEIMSNMTERKTAYNLLLESEQRFRNMFREAGIGIALVDLEGRPISANPALQKILGYSEEELKDMSFPEFTHEEDVDIDVKLFSELVASKRDQYQINKRYYTKNGDVIWGRLTVALIRDHEGNPIYAVGMVEDVTKRIEVEEELARSEEISDSILTNSYQLNGLLTPEGRLLKYNKTAAMFEGIEEEDYVGKMFWDFPSFLLNKETQNEVKGAVLQASKGEDYFAEVFLTDAQGKRRRMNLSIKPIRNDDDQIIFLLPEALDITQRYEAEQELKERREMLESILENSPRGFVAFKGRDNVVITNPALEEMLGYSHEELKEKKLLGVTHPEDVEMSTAVTDRAHEEQKPAVFEKRYITKDGRILPARVVTWGTYNEEGDWIYNFGSIEDISAQEESARALRESEERFRAIFESARDGFILRDVDGKIIDVNQSLLDIFDFDRSIIGSKLEVFQLLDSPEEIVERMEEVEDKGYVFFETNAKRVDDSIFPVEVSSTNIKVGEKELVFGVIRDISLRKQAEEELKKSEQFSEAILSNTFQLMGLLTPEGKIIKVNKRASKFEGLAEDETTGKTFWKLPSFAIQSKIQKNMKQAVLQAASGQIISDDFFLFDGTGNERRMMLSLKPIRDDKEDIKYLLVEGLDITERYEAEEDYRNLVETAQAIICRLDEKGNTLFVNSYVQEVTGYEIKELLGQNWWEVFYPGELQIQVDELYDILARQNIYNHEMTLRTKSGELRTFSWSDYHIKDEKGKIIELDGVGVDVTERIESEKEVLNLRKSAYSQIERNIMDFAELVDQIRNPLSVIVGLAELEDCPNSNKIIENALQISNITEKISRSWDESEIFRQILHEQLLQE